MNKAHNISICTLIVTYNRPELLMKCIESVLNQSYPVENIFIVDNYSAEETISRLCQANYIDVCDDHLIINGGYKVKQINYQSRTVNFYYLRLTSNMGGSGGFYYGMQKMHELGYDWFWLMDDDGEARSDCLQTLLTFSNKYDYLAPLVLDVKNHALLASAIKVEDNIVSTYAEFLQRNNNDVLFRGASPFNGILLSRKLVDTVGYPRKEFFIWGDEIEHLYRCKKNGFPIATITSAIFFHPKNRQAFVKCFKWRILKASSLRVYCYYRNFFHIKREYGSICSALWFSISSLIKNIIPMNYKNCTIILSATFDALRNKWGGESRYLNKDKQ